MTDQTKTGDKTFQAFLNYEVVSTWAWWMPFPGITARWILWKTRRKYARWQEYCEIVDKVHASLNKPK